MQSTTERRRIRNLLNLQINAYISFQAKLTYLFVIRSDFYNNECPETSVKDARESGQMTDPGNAAASSQKCLICMCF